MVPPLCLFPQQLVFRQPSMVDQAELAPTDLPQPDIVTAGNRQDRACIYRSSPSCRVLFSRCRQRVQAVSQRFVGIREILPWIPSISAVDSRDTGRDRRTSASWSRDEDISDGICIVRD